LALAALDVDSDIDEVSLVSGAEELRNRLEILLGAKPQAPGDAASAIQVLEVADQGIRPRNHTLQVGSKSVVCWHASGNVRLVVRARCLITLLFQPVVRGFQDFGDRVPIEPGFGG
jgi:hypothetical protein